MNSPTMNDAKSILELVPESYSEGGGGGTIVRRLLNTIPDDLLDLVSEAKAEKAQAK